MLDWYAEWGRIGQEEVFKGGQKRPFLGSTKWKILICIEKEEYGRT